MKYGSRDKQEELSIEAEMVSRAMSAGAVVDVDPDVADYMGAFEETALGPEDADESRFDADPETGEVINTDYLAYHRPGDGNANGADIEQGDAS